MSCSEGSAGLKRFPGTGCCGTSCVGEVSGCLASEPRIRSCFCQENVGCIDRADCGGFRPRGTAATGACPGPCQCAEEEAWNRNAPPKPNCEWLSNFSELRRQWSDHGRQNNCKCCNCKTCRIAAPCKPCIPAVEKVLTFSENNQSCCNDRLSGGANSSCCQRDNAPSSAMPSSGRSSPPPSRNVTNSSGCCSSGGNPGSSPYDDDDESENICKPCSPSPRPILKQRSCCQCIPGYCMCQPMPRNCNCPPPVQVDARAARDCECECPSSPECACPPSERRFPRTKVKCPNARMCCSTPRPQPGPKCSCTKCQPCLPPPCDPCTSSKCRTETPRVAACGGGSPCDDNSPCRPETPKLPPCRPTPPCNDCRKMAPPCRPPMQPVHFRQGIRQMTSVNQLRTPDSKCFQNSGMFRSDKGYGDDNRDLEVVCQEAQQCHCGSSGSQGCDELCDYCCSDDCDEDIFVELPKGDNNQCGCGGVTEKKKMICHDNCDHCCSMNCDSGKSASSGNTKLFKGLKKRVRMAAGGPYDFDISENRFYVSDETLGESYYQENFPLNVEEFTSTSSLESSVEQCDESTQAKPQEKRVLDRNSCAPKASVVSAVAAPSPSVPNNPKTNEKPRVPQIRENLYSQNSSNGCKLPIDFESAFANLKFSDSTLLKLLEHFWQLGKNAKGSCFQEILLSDNNRLFIPKCDQIDADMKNNIDERLEQCRKSSLCNFEGTPKPNIKAGEFRRNGSSGTVSLDDSITSVSSQEKTSTCRRSRLVCDDGRNVISNLDLQM